MKEYFGSFNYRREDGKPIYDPPELQATQSHPLTVDGVRIDGAWYADTDEGIVRAYCLPDGSETVAIPNLIDVKQAAVLPEGVEAIKLDADLYLLSKTIRGHVQIWGEE